MMIKWLVKATIYSFSVGLCIFIETHALLLFVGNLGPEILRKSARNYLKEVELIRGANFHGLNIFSPTHHASWDSEVQQSRFEVWCGFRRIQILHRQRYRLRSGIRSLKFGYNLNGPLKTRSLKMIDFEFVQLWKMIIFRTCLTISTNWIVRRRFSNGFLTGFWRIAVNLKNNQTLRVKKNKLIFSPLDRHLHPQPAALHQLQQLGRARLSHECRWSSCAAQKRGWRAG